MKHHRKAFLAVLCCMTTLCAMTASAVTYDMDGDGNLTAFDIVLKKRAYMDNPNSSALYDMLMIDSHLLGFQSVPLFEQDETTAPIVVEPQWIVEPKHVSRTGSATYYNLGTSIGYYAINSFVKSRGLYSCALNKKDFATPIPSGAYLRVFYTDKKNATHTVDVCVVDVSGQGSGGVDLDKPAFQQLAALSMGRLSVRWEIIPFPTNDGIFYQLNGSSLQLLGHRYPVYSLEKQKADGNYTAVSRNAYGQFTGLSAGTYTFRVTDIYGNMVVDTVTLKSGQTVEGNYNFPV